MNYMYSNTTDSQHCQYGMRDARKLLLAQPIIHVQCFLLLLRARSLMVYPSRSRHEIRLLAAVWRCLSTCFFLIRGVAHVAFSARPSLWEAASILMTEENLDKVRYHTVVVILRHISYLLRENLPSKLSSLIIINCSCIKNLNFNLQTLVQTLENF